jgi:type IV secretion system protein VirD4
MSSHQGPLQSAWNSKSVYQRAKNEEGNVLIGDRDEATDSTTVGDRGSRSAQRSVRRVAIMPPDVIRTLPFGTGLIMLRSAPPVVARLRMWTARPDADTLRADRADIELLMRAPTLDEPTDPPVIQEE